MMHENDYREDTGDEPVPVSSRLLMIPAFLVVCLVVFSVLYGFSNAARKAVSPERSGRQAPAYRKAADGTGGTRVLDAPQPGLQHHHRRPLPGDPAHADQT